MVLENGEIIERGNHPDLLKQKGRYCGCLAITKGALNSVLEICGMAETEKGEFILLAK